MRSVDIINNSPVNTAIKLALLDWQPSGGSYILFLLFMVCCWIKCSDVIICPLQHNYRIFVVNSISILFSIQEAQQAIEPVSQQSTDQPTNHQMI